MLRRINILELYKSFEIKRFEKCLLPGELELIVEENDKALLMIERLKEIIRKVKELGFDAQVKLEESDWISSRIEIRPQITYDKVVIEVIIPKKEEWSKIKEQLKDKNVEDVLTALEKLAIEEKTKSAMFLKQLEDMKLVTYVETTQTDC